MRIDAYEWNGGREPMLRFGPADGPTVVLALPLFEEANRTRVFGVSLLRALAAHGIGGVLPELPGQGESEVSTAAATLAGMRAAFAAVPGRPVAIRSGALLVGEPAWLLAPQGGPALLRELARVNGGALEGDTVVAGNILSADMIEALGAARLPGDGRGGANRIVRLSSDAGPADRHVDGPALWRRVEPGNDRAFVQLLATDIADWMAACER